MTAATTSMETQNARKALRLRLMTGYWMNRRLALESADVCSRTEVRKDVPTLGGGARCDTTSKMEAEDVGEGTVLLYLNKSIGLASPGVRGAYAELLSYNVFDMANG